MPIRPSNRGPRSASCRISEPARRLGKNGSRDGARAESRHREGRRPPGHHAIGHRARDDYSQTVCRRLKGSERGAKKPGARLLPAKKLVDFCGRLKPTLRYSLFSTTKREPSVERTSRRTPLSSEAFL